MFRIPRLVSTGWYDAISDLIHEFEAGEINPKVSEYLDSQNIPVFMETFMFAF